MSAKSTPLSNPSLAILKSIRISQWPKNLLIFVPLLFSPTLLETNFSTFFSLFIVFCFASSAGYLLNDVMDIEADRVHANKRFRPIASNQILPRKALTAALLIGLCGIMITHLFVGNALPAISAYLVLASLYSLKLKTIKYIDLFVLASLYCLRIMAGMFAFNVSLPPFLIGTFFILFYALGSLKRLIQISSLTSQSKLPRRDYISSDAGALWFISIFGGVLGPILVLAFDYPLTTKALFLTILLWTSRTIYLVHRKTIDEALVEYSIKDPVTWFFIGLGFALNKI